MISLYRTTETEEDVRTLTRTNFCTSAPLPGSTTSCPALCFTVCGSGEAHESRSRATCPWKLTRRDERKSRRPLGIWSFGKGYTPGSCEVFQIPRAATMSGRSLSCCRGTSV